MHQSRRAVAAVVSVSVALGTSVAVSHADSSSALYVNNAASANCSDTGSGAGSSTTPFCTIQAAANAAVAGDTVDIEAGRYLGTVDIKSVGTAAAPIVFQAAGNGNVTIEDASGQTGPALTFDGASYVSFEGHPSYGLTLDMVVLGELVENSSHITLDTIEQAAGIEVAGTSSDVTVSRNWVRAGKGISVDAGSSSDVISTNWIQSSGQTDIAVTDASDVAITSNTMMGASPTQDAISVTGASTGVTVENNIAAYAGVEITVDATAAAGTKVDYNVVSPGPEGSATISGNAYSWAGVDYSSSSAFYKGTGQGEHDITADPQIDDGEISTTLTAPQINSANSAAPGMLSTDMYGNSCTEDPEVAVTGAGSPAYCARGAAQPTYTTTVTASTAQVTALSVDLSTTLSQTAQYYGTSVDVFSAPTPAVNYTINWGDGDTQTVAASATENTTDTPHTYAKAGTYTITDTADLTNGTTSATTTSFTTAGSTYTAYGPSRILDTRNGTGATKAKVAAGSYVSVKVDGVGSIPGNVTAVALNLTVTDATANGYLDAVSDDSGLLGSSLNYGTGQTTANSVIVPVGSDGYIRVYNEGKAGGSADVIADVSGYFTEAPGNGYAAATLKRLLDTRNGTGAAKAKVAANAGVPVTIAGADSIPDGVTAVAVHVTVTDTTGNGWIAAEADGAGTPSTSVLNYGKGQTISNTVIVPVAANGKIELYNGGGSTSVDLIADVSGFFSAGSTAAYVAIFTFRAWDTRVNGDPLTPDSAETYDLAETPTNSYQSDFPADATMVTNITVTDATANGYVTAYPSGTARPGVSNVNYGSGQTIANLALLPTAGIYQAIDIYNQSTGYGDLILDVTGYFANS